MQQKNHRSEHQWGNLPAEQKPKLLEQVQEAIHTRHYSLRTDRASGQWIKRFILFRKKHHIVVREGKSNKDRITMLPLGVKTSLVAYLTRVRALHLHDLARGFGSVYLPDALHRKYPKRLERMGLAVGGSRPPYFR